MNYQLKRCKKKAKMELFNPQEEKLWRETVISALDRIEKQTIRTNGRVSKLESWRSYIAGSLAVIGLCGVLISYIYVTQQTLQDQRIQNLIAQINKI